MFLLNTCPRRVLKNKTQEEAFPREKTNVSHFQVFGSPLYIHVPKEKRKKLEPFMKGVFVGYSESFKAYRMYVPS